MHVLDVVIESRQVSALCLISVMAKLFLLFMLPVLLLGCEKTVTGIVFDCETQNPVAAATVAANQIGWGVSNGSIVWDKVYITTTITNDSGYFELTYTEGDSAKLHVVKEGYHSAEQFELPGKGIKIGLLKGKDPLSFTHNCRPIAQCIQCADKNGTTECRDICFDK